MSCEHLPKVGDTVIQKYEDDYSRENIRVLKMIGEVVNSKGVAIYVLESNTPYYPIYVSVDHSAFEHSGIDENAEYIEPPECVVVRIENKKFIEKTHDKKMTLVEADVFLNEYTIYFSEKASEAVRNDVKQMVDEFYTRDNMTKYLSRKDLKSIRWEKDKYLWRDENPSKK